MSNALAIATVTETLLNMLQGSLTGANVAGAQVTALRPDAQSGLPNPGVNIFLYQVSPNPSWRNADLPTRKADRSLLRRPQAALDLHYLLTFYGDDTTLDQQRLLGAVARQLQAQPVLPRSTILQTQASVGFLNGADLADQVELVRFTPINFSLEELSKLWSVFLKTDYVLSVAYMASVVLIETDDIIPLPALPVLAPNVYALPFLQPVITQIVSAGGAGSLIVPDSPIVLIGQNLIVNQSVGNQIVTGSTQVLIGGIEQTPIAVSSNQITVLLPPGLTAGVQTAQVIQSLLLGTPPTPHKSGFQSDVAAFVLHPVIQKTGSPPGDYDITVQAGVGSPPGDLVTVKVDPPVSAGQQALLELLQLNDPTAVYLFAAGPINNATDTLAFEVQGLPAGDYLVRVRVDGAESPLDLDPSGSPVAPGITL